MNKYDIIKGIGIIFVVAGHIFSGAPSQVIYIFHMPLFFFLSGYLFNKKPIVSYFKKKTVHLLLPYVTYLFILLVLAPLIGFLRTVVIEGNSDHLGFYLRIFAKAIYGGEALKGVTGVFWFITCLFFTQQIYNLLARLPLVKRSVIIILFYAASVINSRYHTAYPFPLCFNVTAIALTYYHLGNYLKTHKIPEGRVFTLFVLLLSIAGALLKMKGLDVGVNLKYTDYGTPILNIVFPLSFIWLIFKASEKLELSCYPKRVLGFIGRASMTIMFLHQFFHFVISPRLGLADNHAMTFLLSIVGPIAIHIVISKVPCLNVFLLGEFPKDKEATNR
jgi:fucose 4-O-acetylase-like acetyltransferase